nr:FCD domain-containing protein [uncultured Pseudomonas sp.]
MITNEIPSVCSSSGVALVIDKIRDQVATLPSEWGKAIPSEEVLADRFNVNSHLVRQALGFLVDWEILEAGPSNEFYAKPYVTDVDDFRAKNRVALRDYLEVHFILETQTARLAARRRTMEDIRGLWFALGRRGEYSVNEDLTSFVDRDQAVHEAVAAASHNQVLWSVYRSLNQAFHRPYLSIFADSELFEPGLEAHSNVVEAIIYGDEDAAVRAVHALFLPLLERLSLSSDMNPVHISRAKR